MSSDDLLMQIANRLVNYSIEVRDTDPADSRLAAKLSDDTLKLARRLRTERKE
jgi:hypothetical protein